MNNERCKLIEQIKNFMPIDNEQILWGDLCYFTKFDRNATALSYGFTWEKDIKIIPIGHLKMALYNLINFPNDDEDSNSKKAGYGKSQSRIDYLKQYENKEKN